MTSNKPPPYRIETDHFLLRCYRPEDAPLLKEAVDSSLEHLRPWMPWAHQEPTELAVKIAMCRKFRGQFDTDSDYVYGLFNLEETQLLGGCGLHTRQGPQCLEIGYWVRADACKKGLASGLTQALTKAAFEVVNIPRVEVHVDPKNVFSARVPRKLGFHLDGVRREIATDSEGNPRDTEIYTMLAREYPGSKPSKFSLKAYDVLGQPLLVSLS